MIAFVVEEIARNLTGFFLALLGLTAIAFGEHHGWPTFTQAGHDFAAASLIAFQIKRASSAVPDPLPPGSTVDTSVTTPSANT